MSNIAEEPSKKTGSRGKAVLIVILILILGAIGYVVFTMVQKRGQNPVSQEAVQEESIFSVNTTFARVGEIQDHLDINGDIVANETVDVYPDTVGKVSRLPVTLGSFVRKDQVLAWVDPSRPGMNYSESPVRSPITGTVKAIY
jgi:multidrug efflux pump subunit AcrA (membrane-fusion protein)